MPGITDVWAVLSETRELLKQITPSGVSGQTAPVPFVIGLPALAVTKFSLPSRCSWALLTSTSAINFSFNSAASFSFAPLAAAASVQLAGNGPLDLSNLHLHCIAASSGVTVTAWVQQAAPLAT